MIAPTSARPPEPGGPGAHPLRYAWSRDGDGRVRLELEGRLDVDSMPQLWRQLDDELAGSAAALVDASELEYCDGAGIAFLVELRHRAGGRAEYRGLAPETRAILDSLDPKDVCHDREAAQRTSLPESVGTATSAFAIDLRDLVIYLGELVRVLGRSVVRPFSLRWRDTLFVVERAGSDAVPIVALVGFLIGLIMAFQSAIPMRQLAVEIFVADLVGVSMVRELGPLMAAVVLAGRSGSAFAAEIGTMKVNEEVDALKTMGLDPVQFLVAPRVVAGMFVIPFLSLVCTLAGLLGGLVVMLSLGFTTTVYVERLGTAIELSSFVSGVAKSLAFGALVAGVGCARGLRTGRGPTAVGDSATRAVVSGIVLIAFADAIFAVLFFALDI